jgi:hypothetical protein
MAFLVRSRHKENSIPRIKQLQSLYPTPNSFLKRMVAASPRFSVSIAVTAVLFLLLLALNNVHAAELHARIESCSG